MSAVVPKFSGGSHPISYTADSAVTGGMVVERLTGTNRVQKAGAGSLIAVGVARNDAVASPTTPDQIKVGDVNQLTVERDCVIAVTYAASATVGQKLICAANGQVTPAGATPDARTVIGEAHEAAGSGETKLARIY